ncbi:MAG: hypothetical protein GWN99_13240 [Gemmatimonadetes bacterium]|uniref:Calcineurin-like phosphoesterase domain-containing protein n=1 Tax=Candidatus Kutchimonas denitrificans TaxID=3056748 RepID=A0AAE4Z9N8_9BACT|nr:hypothetical protein [Gemmatimonadota bacterium]NIR75844.1 hypothetical protein [Candidatus Kutchimonas denitrificans]NIS02011.1 hypothetical protein [Gemmatimonadota bacterium]NIT67815.1 hypothetical protein [Gemmatimonadota bacterium]NIU53802.1 hypothetical protein [Gemmatimonadota bacterium]
MSSETDWIHKRLEEEFVAAEGEASVLDLDTARYIIFSDHHKGQRDGADDFWRCERAYHAALGYYYESGHTLVVLGDVEELWECRPKNVVASYEYTLQLESDFYEDGRYLRYSGNHDDEWESVSSVEKYLRKFFPEFEVRQAARFRVQQQGTDLGTLFLAHGHQGTTFSDRHRWLAKFVVRNVWRPIQRFLKVPSTTPAKDFKLRQKHDRTLYAWAAGHEKTLFVAGHTHRPVFGGLAHHAELEQALAEASGPRAAELRAELEWIKAQEGEQPGDTDAPDQPVKPCYFNTGCCSFGDGDITGLEIIDGAIRLVRWPNDAGDPKPKILASADLASEIYAEL